MTEPLAWPWWTYKGSLTGMVVTMIWVFMGVPGWVWGAFAFFLLLRNMILIRVMVLTVHSLARKAKEGDLS